MSIFLLYDNGNRFVGAFINLVYGHCRTHHKPNTHQMIQEYVEKKYGFKVHTAYIAEVKRSLGLTMYDAPNVVEKLKQSRKHPPKEKAEAITETLKYFEVI